MSTTNAKIWAVIVVAACVGAWVAPAPAAFAPSDIGGLRLWLDAGSLGLADGASVDPWASSHNPGVNPVAQVFGNHTAPTYQAAGLNGQPSVLFDSTSLMRFYGDGNTSNFLDWSEVVGDDGSSGLTAFAATGIAWPLSGGTRAIMGDANGVLTPLSYVPGRNNFEGYRHALSAPQISVDGVDLSVAVLATRWSNAAANAENTALGTLTDATGGVHTATVVDTNSGLGIAGHPTALGGRTTEGAGPIIDSGFIGGQLGELIIYGRALSDSEMGQVQAYLDTKYDVPEPATLALLAAGGLLVFRRR